MANDAFVTKLNPAGTGKTDLLYSTFLGGSGNDVGRRIAIDGVGNAYIAGSTGSNPFPITANATQSTYGGAGDAFVALLNPGGTALSFATYLGGSAGDAGFGIAVDASGAMYVAGNTSSTDFPLMSPFQNTNGGGQDMFITKLTPMILGGGGGSGIGSAGEGNYIQCTNPYGTSDGGFGFSRINPKAHGTPGTLQDPFWQNRQGERTVVKGALPWNTQVTVLNVSHQKHDADGSTQQPSTAMQLSAWLLLSA